MKKLDFVVNAKSQLRKHKIKISVAYITRSHKDRKSAGSELRSSVCFGHVSHMFSDNGAAGLLVLRTIKGFSSKIEKKYIRWLVYKSPVRIAFPKRYNNLKYVYDGIMVIDTKYGSYAKIASIMLRLFIEAHDKEFIETAYRATGSWFLASWFSVSYVGRSYGEDAYHLGSNSHGFPYFDLQESWHVGDLMALEQAEASGEFPFRPAPASIRVLEDVMAPSAKREVSLYRLRVRPLHPVSDRNSLRLPLLNLYLKERAKILEEEARKCAA